VRGFPVVNYVEGRGKTFVISRRQYQKEKGDGKSQASTWWKGKCGLIKRLWRRPAERRKEEKGHRASKRDVGEVTRGQAQGKLVLEQNGWRSLGRSRIGGREAGRKARREEKRSKGVCYKNYVESSKGEGGRAKIRGNSGS